tara:strand:+ start:9875 stop:11521 length:1647 start_codon:yes stop_codon:yes gene_type:complete
VEELVNRSIIGARGWRRWTTLFVWPASVVGFLVAVAPITAQDLPRAVDEFWAAESIAEVEEAISTVLALKPGIESLWPLVRAGISYDGDVPLGRQLVTRSNADGVEYRYLVYIPDDYDPGRRYPLRVYLHGGVSRPRRDEADWWRNQDRYTRSDSIVVFPEAWGDAMWWQANQIENLAGVLNDLKRDYNINENLVHLLGVSDGATGVFYHAFKAPTPWAGFLSFNGHPVVLANPATGADGQMYVTNLRNKPFFVINGGQDRLYPVNSVVPFFQLFVDAGVYLDFQPKPESGHNMEWWDEESANIDAFVVGQGRQPLPDRVVWETESTERFNRAHWVVITELGDVSGQNSFDDFNEITPPGARVPLGFNRLGQLDSGAGILLIDIMVGSIAESAGVSAGDVLVGVNNIPVATVDDLRAAIQTPRETPGLSIRIERDGQPLSFVLTPPDRSTMPPSRQAFPRALMSGRVQLLRNGNEIRVATRGVQAYKLLLSPEQFDFTAPIKVITNDVESFEGIVEPNPRILLDWAARDRDRTMLFGAELEVRVGVQN